MSIKIIGALLVIAGCGGFGFLVSANFRREQKMLKELINALEYMEYELEYQHTALPDLCRKASDMVGGAIQEVLINFSNALSNQVSATVSGCMYTALRQTKNITGLAYDALKNLGRVFGQFDMEGQKKSIMSARDNCKTLLNALVKNQAERQKSYRTLGLCAGAAIVILFI